jgi:hypothetical protein
VKNYGGERDQGVAGKPRRLPRQTPYKRTYPSGHVVWVARYLDLEGKARYAKPSWHRGKSSFRLRRDAQKAIDEALAERASEGF